MQKQTVPTRLSLLVTPDTPQFFEGWINPLIKESLAVELAVSSISQPSLRDITDFDIATVPSEILPELLQSKLILDLTEYKRDFLLCGLEPFYLEDRIIGIPFMPFRSDTVLICVDKASLQERESQDHMCVDPATGVLYLVKLGLLTLELSCKAFPPPVGKQCPEAVKRLTEPSCSAEFLPPGKPCPQGNVVPPWFPKLKCFSVLEDYPNCGYSKAYNCLAWALGKTNADIWPGWCVTASEMQTFLASKGYKLSKNCDPECGKRKLAVFGVVRTDGACHADKKGKPGTGLTFATHVAREFHDGGWWSSKIGQLWCIVHRLRELECDGYGKVLFCMEKAEPTANSNLCPKVKIDKDRGPKPRKWSEPPPSKWDLVKPSKTEKNEKGGDRMSGMNSEPATKEAFEFAFRRWQQDIQKTEIQIMSSWDARAMLPSYRAIIDLGRAALPFIFEKVREGHYGLNEAVAEITGVNLRDKHPNDIGEQRLSELWIEWWEQRQSEAER